MRTIKKAKIHSGRKLISLFLALCTILTLSVATVHAESSNCGFIIATEKDESKAITVEELDSSAVHANYRGNSNYKVIVPSGTETVYVKFVSGTFSDATAYVGDTDNSPTKRCISQSYKDTLTGKYTRPPGSIMANGYTVSPNYQDGWYAMPLSDLTVQESVYPGITFNPSLRTNLSIRK